MFVLRSSRLQSSSSIRFSLKRRRQRTISTIDTFDRHAFDLNGYVVVRDCVSKEDIERMNNEIDQRNGIPRDTLGLKNTKENSYFSAKGSRIDMGGMLSWDTDVFRSMLTHHRLKPYLESFVGSNYRLDHEPMILLQEKDSEGFRLHGGPIGSDGALNPELQYRANSEGFFNSLLAVSIALSPVHPGDGGLCLLRGSHKSTFRTPDELLDGSTKESRHFLDEHLHSPSLSPGDAVLFSEATVHGAKPWIAEHQRRVLLMRFSPRTVAYGRSYFDDPEWNGTLERCTPDQAKILRPPYSSRLDQRDPEKLLHDKRTFGHEYF